MDAVAGIQNNMIQSSTFQSSAFDNSTFNPSFDGGLNVQQVNPAEDTTLGDKFFQILSDTKQEIQEKTGEIEKSLKVDDVSPVELLRLQYEIAEITIQQELISKGVSKSTQNVDTLLKAQ